MNAPSEITVIRARLPYLDRRALSQAWYTALRLAAQAGPAVPMLQPRSVPIATPPRRSLHATHVEPPVHMPGSSFAPHRKPVQSSQKTDVGPRPGFAPRANKTDNNPAHPARNSSPAHVAAFTVTLGEARVRVVVRGEGNRLALTAVCSTRHAELVRLALAHASLGLRMYGALVDTTLHYEDSAHD